ncbi:MAG: HAMP domain-containing sensor histidine kinase [Anaerolineaceae bacterium]|nr:HAMP domain-containing sensor histidine kinase [Anaerolineaceae bacterium]
MATTRVRHLILLLLGVWLCAALLIPLLARPLFAPPAVDEQQLFLLMGLTGSVSILIAWSIGQPGLGQRLRRLRDGLMLLSLLTILTLFANFWLLARQMFLDAHDLGLSAVLLVFGAWTALGCGYFISNAFTPRIRALARGAERIASGETGTRVPAAGQDELAALARSFNLMAERLEEAAARRERLEQGRRDLIAWTSHDLRTPLASLRLVIEALVDGVAGDEATQQRYLETAQREIRNLSRLIDDLFELSQLESGHVELQLQRSSLGDLLSDTLGALRPVARRREVQLEGEVSDDVDPLLIDPEKIQRVLYNLVSNAIRHTPAGGNVRLAAVARGSGQVRVTVSDSGEGIAAADLPQVFERFWRGGQARSRDQDGERGVGLGLAIARGLVEAHQGRIEVSSQPGAGTEFSFTLPRSLA